MKYAGAYAVEHGPICIELLTYRYHGHSMSDPGKSYRTKEEVADVRKNRDPIEIARHILLDNGWAQEKELKDFEKEVRRDLDAQVELIKKDPYPGPEDLNKDLACTDGHYIRGVEYKMTQHEPLV